MPVFDFFWKAWSTQISVSTCKTYTVRYASPRYGRAISHSPDSKPCSGFAISALPPSAAIVKARNISKRAPSGKFSKSFRAALSHEIGLVFLAIKHMLSYLTTYVKSRGYKKGALLIEVHLFYRQPTNTLNHYLVTSGRKIWLVGAVGWTVSPVTANSVKWSA